jgi:hypothetical protein
MLDAMNGLRDRCAPVGRLEYVVESRQDDRLETWLVVRPNSSCAPRCEELGVALTPGCRLVIEAESLRPVGVLDPALPATPMAAGFNPYFDLPAA